MHVIEGINFSIWSANDIRRESVAGREYTRNKGGGAMHED